MVLRTATNIDNKKDGFAINIITEHDQYEMAQAEMLLVVT